MGIARVDPKVSLRLVSSPALLTGSGWVPPIRKFPFDAGFMTPEDNFVSNKKLPTLQPLSYLQGHPHHISFPTFVAREWLGLRARREAGTPRSPLPLSSLRDPRSHHASGVLTEGPGGIKGLQDPSVDAFARKENHLQNFTLLAWNYALNLHLDT